jgi:uncharacterized protein (TIGR00290 family)
VTTREGERVKTILAWSSGKDSAWALHVLRARGDVEVVGLLTTIDGKSERVAMHDVRRALVRAQADAAGLPLLEVAIPWPCSNVDYERAMGEAMTRAKNDGVETVAFGDLFLEDIRKYREEKLAAIGVRPIFPLWGTQTDRLAREMIDGGLRARVTCIDNKQLDRSFAGRDFDASFVRDLPASVDPCGERGEFHTFAFAGPMFARAIDVNTGDIVDRDGFTFADLLRSPA